MSLKEKEIFAKAFQEFDRLFAQLKSFTRYDDSMMETYNITPEEYDDYVSKCLLNEREYREFLKKYPVMTDLLIRKIRDYINYVNEILQHFYQDRETISKEFHIEQNAMKITKISFNQDEEHFPGRMVARVRLKGGQKIYYKPHSLLLTERYQKIENWLWEKMGLEESRHLVVSGDDYGWEQEVTEAACKCT